MASAGVRESIGSDAASAPVELDYDLSEYLREWRRNTATQQGVPAFVVLHDSTLEQLFRMRPTTLAQIRSVPGFGERKTESYGPQILEATKEFAKGARATQAAQKSSKPAEETRQLLAQGHSLEEVASLRGRQLASVVALVAEMLEAGQLEFQSSWISQEKLQQIEEACTKLGGMDRLRPIKDALPPEITFDEIRLVVAKLRQEKPKK